MTFHRSCMILHTIFYLAHLKVDTGNNYSITTRHRHHIFKTRPRTTFSSKLPNHNFVNIWNEIDENLKLCSSKVVFKQLLRKRYTALYLSHVHCLNTRCLECFGPKHLTVATTKWNHSNMRFSGQFQEPVARPVPCPLNTH